VIIFPVNHKPNSTTQSRLFQLAALGLFLLSLILTLSPAVEYRSWNVDYRWSHWIAFTIWLIVSSLLHRLTIRYLEYWDAIILPVSLLLVGWGSLTIWRLNLFFGIRQCVWFILCIILAFFFFKKDNLLFTLKKYKYFLLSLGLFLAILTFFFGTYPGGVGPKLWLGSHGLYFQPSEPLKLILIIYLSAYFSDRYFLKFSILHTILPTLVLVLSALFILVGQHDMGTALIFIVIYIGMLYITFGRKRIIAIGAATIALAASAGFYFIDLIRIRFQAWIEPWLDSQSGSYQIVQSIIAIAAGGVIGSGFGLGYPSLVPISHSDFIYSAIVEETGLAGSVAIICLFTLLLYRGIHAAIKTSDKFYRFLASGISIYLSFQAILIIGGNIRLLPITGVTLPFVSYGGSSLVTSFLSVLILLKISDERMQLKPETHKLNSFKVGAMALSGGFILLALVTGWWSVVRSQDLQLRVDNSRNIIASLYVKRGQILDRNNEIIAGTSGAMGHYVRALQYIPLSNTIGYYDSVYGIAGLEEAFDDYLNGENGYAPVRTWFNYLLYNRHLPGRNVKLTLDLKIQRITDTMLKGYQGAAVVINASNGEILAMTSYPYFDSNTLDINWEKWKNDENSPFLNRAIHSAYPLGELLSTFLVSEDNSILEKELIPNEDDACAISQESHDHWSQVISDGCTGALKQALSQKSSAYITSIISKYGLSTPINIGLPTNPAQSLDSSLTWQDMIYGENRIRINPLQIAFAMSIFSNHGLMPTPKVLAAVDVDQKGWQATPQLESVEITTEENAETISRLLFSEKNSGWEVTTHSHDENGDYSWYVAGTPSNWEGTPLVIAAVIEKDDPQVLRSIGRLIYQTVTQFQTVN
jgi:cell division protein FtsW (lipid II flippase)